MYKVRVFVVKRMISLTFELSQCTDMNDDYLFFAFSSFKRLDVMAVGRPADAETRIQGMTFRRITFGIHDDQRGECKEIYLTNHSSLSLVTGTPETGIATTAHAEVLTDSCPRC